MNISFNTFSPNTRNSKTFRSQNPNKGKIVFGAMKKSAFKGFDLECVNRFKAPIETFNSIDNLHKWAKNKLRDTLKPAKYRVEDCVITAERMDILEAWGSFFTRDKAYKNNPTLSLIIADGITHNLNNTNKDIPPILYPKALIETVRQIRKNMSEVKGYSFNFEKIYSANLRKNVMKDVELVANSNETKWIKIPSADNDDKNFDMNVEKLRILSHRTWCTKFTHARPYLSAGDMYIYLEKGQPKICIRMINDSIDEIQGKKNNGQVPLDEIENVIEFINKEGLDYRLIQKNIKDAKDARQEFVKIKKELKPLIKENDRKGILAFFHIRANFDDNGKLTISHFQQPSEFYTYKELGINERDLFKGLIKIERDAIFSHSSLTVLEDLETIGKNAYLNNSIISKFPKLKSIGGIARCTNSNVKEFPTLESIGDALWVNDCENISFNSLKTISGDLFNNESRIKEFPSLEVVAGEVHNRNSKTKFPKLNK